MTDRDPIEATLDAAVPPFRDLPDEWDDVLRRAGSRRPSWSEAAQARPGVRGLGVLAAICAAGGGPLRG